MRHRADFKNGGIIAAVILLSLTIVPAHALQVIEGQGEAYPIEEQSQAKIIAEKYQKNQQKAPTAEQLEKIRIVKLSRTPSIAREDRSRTLDVTYTLPFDIQDANGKIILAKGYKYNPLGKRIMTSLIVIDGENPEQIKWAKQKMEKMQPCKVLLSNGSALRVMRTEKLPCYHLNDMMADRFQIENVPCTVVQNGDRLEIQEYRQD